MALKDVNDLPPDEGYAVTVMRADRMLLRPSTNNAMLLAVENTPVCTWDTLFRLLGRGVVEPKPPIPGGIIVYGLSEAWWADKEPAKDAA